MKDFVAREGSMPAIVDFTDVVSVEIQSSIVANRGQQHPVMVGMPRVFVTPTLSSLGYCASTLLIRTSVASDHQQ